MVNMINTIEADEKTFELNFYRALFGTDFEDKVTIDRNTDGYTAGILFEHKQNLIAYGRAKALSQALIYETRFNMEGIPVKREIILVDNIGQTAYVYDAAEYTDIINDTKKYAGMKGSAGIPGFVERSEPKTIKFDMSSAAGMKDIYDEVTKPAEFVKVNIDINNVYGWANFYYQHAQKYGQKPVKKNFFDEIKKPCGALKDFINPWTGCEDDFKYIMDLLNDPMTQKKLGAYYTHPSYATLSLGQLRDIVKDLPEDVDWVAVDVCAGTGNLEAEMTDEELSHTIVNTYEPKEASVLQNRIGSRVRYNMSINYDNPGEPPVLDEDGFIKGSNALSEEFATKLKKVIEDTKKSEKVVKIWYMNPPYVETTGVEFQKKNAGKKASDWKKSYVVTEMKKEIGKTALNDMCNAFIWSAFKMFDADYCVVFAPVKYWKTQHLIDKKFLGGYAVNREHFHAKTPACIMLATWSKEEEKREELTLKALDLDMDGNYVDQGNLTVKRIHSLFSDTYYDGRKFDDDTYDGIACELDGTESLKCESKISVSKAYNKNIVGYMNAKSSGFDNPRLSSNLLVAGKYDGHGFYLREDNFLEKLPIFAASRYTDHVNDWKIMSMTMKSGDGKETYEKDVAEGKLNDFLCKCLIWTGLTHYAHMRSLNGSDGRLYLNQLCFDGKDTLASRTLKQMIADGYKLTKEEEELFEDWKTILSRVRQKFSDGTYRYPYDKEKGTGYNPEFKYGLFQIDEEVNYKIESAPDRRGKTHMVRADGDLNNMIKAFKAKVKKYYINNIVGTLFEYEFLK